MTSPRGKPKLDAIDLRVVPYTRSAAAVALGAREADIAYPCPPAGEYRWLADFARRRRVTSIVFFIFNVHGALSSAEERRWFVQSIDLAAVQRSFDDDLSTVFTSYTMPNRPNTMIARLAQPTRDARDHLRAALHGRQLRIVYAANPVYERVANLVQQELGGEHFAQTERFAAAVLLDRKGPLSGGAFDVALIGLPYGENPDLAPNWSCKSVAPSGANIARWCDLEFENNLERRDTTAALERLIEELVCVPLGPAREDIRLDHRVGGFPMPTPFVPFTYSCAQWTTDAR